MPYEIHWCCLSEKVIRKAYVKAKMASTTIDELKLIADLLNGAPGVDLELFRRAKITTIQLLTFTEEELLTSIGVQPEVDTRQLWSWIDLHNVTLVSEKVDSIHAGVENHPQAEQPTEDSETEEGIFITKGPPPSSTECFDLSTVTRLKQNTSQDLDEESEDLVALSCEDITRHYENSRALNSNQKDDNDPSNEPYPSAGRASFQASAAKLHKKKAHRF
ncbi:uncharacterized protein LOC129719205 [Wyeomyia smithii]|uniref:uncharacterized protein LOC129719205 n=1 Tax=Wyeomyia smithii TaxID=174621 RepID=UPI002467C4C7|nr:uncharacterized protein LOC129719205 [Wyeomyia smithii]